MSWIAGMLVPAGVALVVVWRATGVTGERLAAAPAASGIALGLASVVWSALFFSGIRSGLANAVLGNDPMAAALEITLLGPELRAGGDVTCAVAGADVDVMVDDGRVAPNVPFEVRSGSRIRFGARSIHSDPPRRR